VRYVAASCNQLFRIHVLEISECYINSGERIGGSALACVCVGWKTVLSAGVRMARISVKTIFVASLLVCLLAAKGKVTFSR